MSRQKSNATEVKNLYAHSNAPFIDILWATHSPIFKIRIQVKKKKQKKNMRMEIT